MNKPEKTKLEKTIEQLEKQVRPARPGMGTSKELLYSNEETGTVVYQIYTDNATLPGPIIEHLVWGQFLVGNPDGYSESGCYLASEASFSIGKITENKNMVRIPRQGYVTMHFGIEIKVGDLKFEKSKFKLYDNNLEGGKQK